MQQVFSAARFSVKPKTRQELAIEYGVHRNTVARWCVELSINARRRLSCIEVVKLYQYQGIPGQYEMTVQLT